MLFFSVALVLCRVLQLQRDSGKTGFLLAFGNWGRRRWGVHSDSAFGSEQPLLHGLLRTVAGSDFPTIEESRTVPFALAIHCSFTTPPMPRCFSTSGYCAGTFFRILRVVVVSATKAGAQQAQQTARQAPRQLFAFHISTHRQTAPLGGGILEIATWEKWGTDKASPR
jgi:hypothetical protein